MADTPQAPSQPYGPFTDVLTGPLSGQRQQALQQPSGWGGPGAALANYANAFIKSAQVGQREKYERSEMEKAAHERNFDSVHSYIQNSPNISSEGKKAAEQAYLTGKFANVAGHSAENEKDHKDHPLSQLTRAITQGVLGPGDNKKHKDMGVDVNALLNIANDERYKIDPGAMRAEAGGAIADVLRKAATGTPGTLGTQASALPATPRQIPVPAMGAAPAEPFNPDNAVQYQPPTNVSATPPTPPAPATVQGFGMSTPETTGAPDTPGVEGRQLTQPEALRDPAIQGRLQALEKAGINWMQDPYLSQLIGGLPKTGIPKPQGAPRPLYRQDPVTGVYGSRMTQIMLDPVTNQQTERDLGPAVGTPSSALPNMQHTWVETPDHQKTMALFNPKKPGGFTDFSGKPMPDGTKATQPPVGGSGQASVYRLIAKSQLGPNASEAEVENLAGGIALQYYDTRVAGQQQAQGVVEAEAGVPRGPGLTTPHPNRQGQQPLKPAGTPPPAPNGGATPPGSPATPQAGSLGAFSNQRDYDDASTYLNSAVGTGAAPGKMSIRAQHGMQALGRATGLTPPELSQHIVEAKALNTAVTDLTKTSNQFRTLDERIGAHTKLLLDAAQKNDAGGVPIANKTIQWLQQHTTDSPDLAALNIAMNAVQREYGSLLSNAPSSARPVLASVQQEANKILDSSSTIATIAGAVAQIQKESATTQGALAGRLREIAADQAKNPISRAFANPATQAPPATTATGNGAAPVTLRVFSPIDNQVHSIIVPAAAEKSKRDSIDAQNKERAAKNLPLYRIQ